MPFQAVGGSPAPESKTGASPFKGTPEAIMHSVCYHDPDPPSRAPNVTVRNVFDAVVARALMKRPEDRFPSTHAFRTAVLAAYDKPVAETVSEATIITEIARTAAPDATPSAGARATPTGGSTPPSLPPSSTPPPTGWDALVLGNVERELARFLGPVARVLVRRSAREHTSVEGLAIALTAHLTSPDDREAFLKKIVGRATLTPAAKTVDPSTTRFIAGPNDAVPSEQDLERLSRVLTSYIGPIAKVLVKRTAQGGITRRELAMKLAESIPAEADRARFLRDAGV